jgi:hypothetical protein
MSKLNDPEQKDQSANHQELADKRYAILKALIEDYEMESDLVDQLYTILQKRKEAG